MSAAVLLYVLVFTGLLAGAAWFFDRALRSLERSTRWVWIVGMGGGALAPLLAILFPTRPPALPALPADVLTTPTGLPAPPALPDASFFLFSLLDGLSSLELNGPILLTWVVSSGILLLLLGWTGMRLRRELVRWEHREVAGEQVLLSSGLGPAVVGLLRPAIVLPPWALELGEEKLAMVLLHEAEHRRARDPALLTLGTLLVAAAPLNPGLWWMLRRLRLAVEGDCDARVLARGTHPKRYGRLLLEVATLSGRSLHPAPALVERGRSFLERRLTMIGRSGARRRWSSTAWTTAAGGVLLALACQTPTPMNAVVDGPAPVDAVPVEAADAQGTIVVRGRPLGDLPSDPLVLVNGVRLAAGSPLMDRVNPQDIGSIEVIKGSRALQLYGEDAGQGVILITLTEAGSERLGVDPPAVESQVEAPPEAATFEAREVRSETLRADSLLALPGMVLRGGLDLTGVVIRGRDTTAASGGEPLYIVDGVILSSSTIDLDPRDIDRIEVIKGSAAEALYGARGANGVIVITTKK